MKKWMFLVTMLFIVSGCQNNRSAKEEAYDLRTDETAPNYMSNRDQDKTSPENMSNRDQDRTSQENNRGKDRQHLVEDDITGQNPNFLDLKRTGSGSEAGAGNIGVDTNKAKEVIAATNEFVTDSVVVNGDRMWVAVYKKGMLKESEKVDAEARLHRKLVHALPRYKIEVRVQEDRR